MPYGVIDSKLVFVGLDGNTAIAADSTVANTKISVPPGGSRTNIRFGIYVPAAMTSVTGMTVELQESSDGTTFTSLSPIKAIFTCTCTAGDDVDFPVQLTKKYAGVAVVKTAGSYGSAGKMLCYMTTHAAGNTGKTTH